MLLKGQTIHPEEFLKNSIMFVLSSDYEGMPNALMEAMAVGVPCISTDCPCGGPKTLIRNKVDGYLFEPGNWSQLADQMESLMSNKKEITKLAGQAKERAKMFSPVIVFEMWLKYINAVTSE